MPSKEKSTESKLKDPALEKVVQEANALEEQERGRLSKAQRRDNIVFGGFTVFYIVMAVLAVVRGDWGQLLFTLAMWIWIPLVYLNNKIINHQRYTINMQFGLRDIENKALIARVDKEGK